MTVCPMCGKGLLHEIRRRTLIFPAKVETWYKCPHCGYETQTLPGEEEETEAQRIMREHLRDYHGVE